MSWLIHCLFVAVAGPGFYDEDSLSAASRTFREANAISSTYRQAAARSGAVASALDELRLGLDLLGADAPADQRDRLDALEVRFVREHAALQHFVDTLVDDFDGAFRDAMERALLAYPEAVRCEARVARGPRLPGLPQRTRDNPDCVGDDLNDAIAAAMDTDPELHDAVQAILGRPWPEITVDQTPQGPIGPGSTAVPVAAFAQAVMPAPLREITQAEEEARLPIDAAVEQGLSEAEAARLRERVTAIETEVAEARAAAFADVRAAVDRIRGRDTAWCANPEYLGGCTVPLVDEATLRDLGAHRKVLRITRRL